MAFATTPQTYPVATLTDSDGGHLDVEPEAGNPNVLLAEINGEEVRITPADARDLAAYLTGWADRVAPPRPARPITTVNDLDAWRKRNNR